MALSLRDVECDPIANRALNELMHHYAVAEEKIRLVLTKKAGDMKLFLYDLDDLHQLDFIHNQQMAKEIERLRVLSTTTVQQRESWKVRALMAETQLLETGMLRSSAIWQSGSTLITRPDKASRRLFETRSSRKSGTRLTASIKDSRPPAPRRRDHLRRPDRADVALDALEQLKGISGLIRKLALASQPSREWNDDDFDDRPLLRPPRGTLRRPA